MEITFRLAISLLAFVLLSLSSPLYSQRSKPARHAPAKPAHASGGWSQRVRAILDSGGAREAYWGIQVVSLRNGATLFSWNPEKMFVPASTSKLFTTATALVRLGPGFTYRTTVESDGAVDGGGTLHGNLILVGRGDPNLSARELPYNGRTERSSDSMKVFESLADAVVQRGVRAIDGDLIADDSYFVEQPYGEGWTAGDMLWGFGAPVTALAANDNVITVTVLPGRRAEDAGSVRQQPMDGYFELTNRVVTVGASEPRRISFSRQPGSRRLLVWGRIPAGEESFTESVAMDDPARFTGEFFRRELESRGIAIKGDLRFRHQEPYDVADLRGAEKPAASSAGAVLAAHESFPLVESLKVIEKVSQNLHAEMLLRTLGRERRNVGSVEAGLAEIGQFLGEIGVDAQEVHLLDASGLSRETQVTPRAVVALLKSMYDSKLRATWIDLLPVAGEDGSLRERFRSPGVRGRIHAKTGSMEGVAALAGYVTAADAEPLAFAIFMNHGRMKEPEARSLIDRIATEIAAGTATAKQENR
jgi:D-alanyl-D-alanine carboxypeptidase/D-alanyl-D-alanine-endopeptidase (penicillin-binding protein 4)